MLKNLSILLIDDDAIEIMKVHRTMSLLEVKHNLIEALNGEEALDILNTQSKNIDLILLDLNMPKLNGIKFLNTLKNNTKFKHIPTVILTTSENYKDIKECYDNGIAGYITKPFRYDDYVIKLKSLFEYWSYNVLINT